MDENFLIKWKQIQAGFNVFQFSTPKYRFIVIWKNLIYYNNKKKITKQQKVVVL